MDQQTRWLVFFIGVVAIMVGWNYLFPPPPEPVTAPPAASSSTAVPQGSTAPSSAPAETKLSAPAEGPAKLHQTANVPVSQVTIETDDYIATFSNQGAVLTGFQLVEKGRNGKYRYLNRETHKPVQMVNDSDEVRPFTISYPGFPNVNQQTFEVSGSSKKLIKPGEEAHLTFRVTNEFGLSLEKEFTFKNGDYLIGLNVTVNQNRPSLITPSSLVVEWPETLGKEEITGTNARGASAYRVTTLEAGQVEAESAKKSQESKEYPAPVGWTALANQFFMAALIPDNATGAASVKVIRDFNMYKTPTQEDPNPGKDPAVYAPRPQLIYQVPGLKQGESFTRSLKAFIGPQDYELLKALNLDLDRVIDFGMFGFISVYMLKLLKWFDTWCNNWGLGIILLSIAVKLVLWFPTHNSYKNMYMMSQKTRELQPKLDAIKRKYPDDKQKQSQETMALYQQAGLNPMGGCLPMLLQLPVFYALYATLGHSIELRGASFLWLPDLSLKDPFFVFPLLMGGTMILQQKVSGQMATQAAGQQKFMMWFFPIFLTFISFQWPAGLLVYWVVTNLLSMVQQKIVNLEIQKTKKKEEGIKT